MVVTQENDSSVFPTHARSTLLDLFLDEIISSKGEALKHMEIFALVYMYVYIHPLNNGPFMLAFALGRWG